MFKLKEEILYIVIPCYNEEEVLPETSTKVLEKLNKLIDNKKLVQKVEFYS